MILHDVRNNLMLQTVVKLITGIDTADNVHWEQGVTVYATLSQLKHEQIDLTKHCDCARMYDRFKRQIDDCIHYQNDRENITTYFRKRIPLIDMIVSSDYVKKIYFQFAVSRMAGDTVDKKYCTTCSE